MVLLRGVEIITEDLTPEEEYSLRKKSAESMKIGLLWFTFLMFLSFLFVYYTNDDAKNADFISPLLFIMLTVYFYMFTWYLLMRLSNYAKWSFLAGFFSGFLGVGIFLYILYYLNFF